MDSCDEGKIIIDETDISKFSNRELTKYRRYDVGFVFQFYNLVQNLTAKENVELATQISNNALDVEKTLELVGLGHRKDNFPKTIIWWRATKSFYSQSYCKKSKTFTL